MEGNKDEGGMVDEGEPSNWTVDKLQEVQSRVAGPLVLYWSVRVRLRGRMVDIGMG